MRGYSGELLFKDLLSWGKFNPGFEVLQLRDG
jgi:hypothetical protein